MARKKKSEQYNYLIDYITESTEARKPLKGIIERAVKAYKQCPATNSYKANAERYLQSIDNSGNTELLACVRQVCDSIPESTNDTVFNAVETFVSLGMGGASQFEYQPADEYEEKDAYLIDRLSELAKFFHDDNKIDSIVPEAVRQMVLQGQANFFLKPIEGGRFKVSLIDAWNILQDPRASRTNRNRYIGYTEIASWEKVKEHIYKTGSGYQLSIMNDVDQYLREIQNWGPTNGGVWSDQIRADLDTFRHVYNLHTKTSESKDEKGEPVSPAEPGYKGDDVEVSYIWDLISNVYAVIINRRFIIQVDEHPYRKSIPVSYTDADGNEKERKVEVDIDSPIITIPFLRLPWETYPVSPLFYCLDDFDAICSMESVMNHNFSIMAPITFQSTSYDAEQMAMLGQVAGQIAEGTMNTLGVLNKSHDMSPILAAIERREQRIKRMLGATDQFELQAMLGNRATASEVSAISSAVSQRMNAPLANIECGIGEMMQKMFAMSIVFSDSEDFTFPFKGGISTVTKKDLLGRSLVQAKLKSRIRVEEQEQGRNALMVLQTLIQAPGVDAEQMVSTLVPIITRGVVNRRQAESFIAQPVIDASMMMQQAPAATAEQPANVIDPTMLEGITPGEMDELMGSMGSPEQGPVVDTGFANDEAGIEANQVMI